MNPRFKRKIAKELFNKTNLDKNAMNWHVWKRAFDLGYDIAFNKSSDVSSIIRWMAVSENIPPEICTDVIAKLKNREKK